MIEFILLETNGLADPCELVQKFWLDEELMSKVNFHSCVSLIDCVNFSKKLKSTSKIDDQPFPENELLLRQLVFADKILLNKTDISEKVDDILDCICEVNNQAEVIQTQFAYISLEQLFKKVE